MRPRVRERPLIGVTGPDKGGWPAWVMTWLAIRRAGGRAMHITPSSPVSVEKLDGLVIGGGADVDPALYGKTNALEQLREQAEEESPVAQDPRAKRPWYWLVPWLFTGAVSSAFKLLVLLWFFRRWFSTSQHQTGDRERDRLESELIEGASEREIPILGICRGMQLLNVARGGTLHGDITDFYEESPRLQTLLPKKRIAISPRTRIEQILGPTEAQVNSLHHQSVKNLGRGLRVSALESNGIIQAIEDPKAPFFLGVQWHPEFLPQDERQQNLFIELVNCSRVSRTGSTRTSRALQGCSRSSRPSPSHSLPPDTGSS